MTKLETLLRKSKMSWPTEYNFEFTRLHVTTEY